MKKKILITTTLLIVIMVSIGSAKSLNNTVIPPKPVGGIQALLKDIYYPQGAIDARLESQVKLSFRIDQWGSVSYIEVIESGGEMFDESVISAIEKSVWEPASYNNKCIPIRFELPFRFVIK